MRCQSPSPEREPWLDDPLVREAFEIIIQMCRQALRKQYRLEEPTAAGQGVVDGK